MDIIEKRAAATRPKDHIRVKSGEIRPDDLIFSWSSNEWLPANSPLWRYPTKGLKAEDCVFVARSSADRPLEQRQAEKKPDTQENIGPLHLVDKREGQLRLF